MVLAALAVACSRPTAGPPPAETSAPAASAAPGTPGADDAPAPTAPAQPVLQDIKSVGEFQSIFNQDAGSIRLILLLSPT